MILDNKRICLDKKEIKKDANIRDTNNNKTEFWQIHQVYGLLLKLSKWE